MRQFSVHDRPVEEQLVCVLSRQIELEQGSRVDIDAAVEQLVCVLSRQIELEQSSRIEMDAADDEIDPCKDCIVAAAVAVLVGYAAEGRSADAKISHDFPYQPTGLCWDLSGDLCLQRLSC